MKDPKEKEKEQEKNQKLQNLIYQLKILENEKKKIIKELESKRKEREEFNKILKEAKSKHQKQLNNIDQKIVEAKKLYTQIQTLIQELKRIQNEQERILNEISQHPLLKQNSPISNQEKNVLVEIVLELQKEIQNFKTKRIELEKKIDQLKSI